MGQAIYGAVLTGASMSQATCGAVLAGVSMGQAICRVPWAGAGKLAPPDGVVATGATVFLTCSNGAPAIAILIPACAVTSVVAGNLAPACSGCDFASGRVGFPVASAASVDVLHRSLNDASGRGRGSVPLRGKMRRGQPIAQIAVGSGSALTRLTQSFRIQARHRDLGP
jgi:hypothetical protein